MSKTLNQRRSMIEQAVQATLGAYGSWSHLSVLVVGTPFEREGEFLLNKGVRESAIDSCSIESLIPKLKEKHVDLLLLSIPREVPYTGAYGEIIDTLHQLRDTITKPRVMVIESEILGYDQPMNYGDPKVTIKQLYLQILSKLKATLGEKDYIQLHEGLLKDVREENYEERLCYLYEKAEVKTLLTKDVEAQELFIKAQLRTLIDNHSSRTFEAGFIAGSKKEKEALLAIVKSTLTWENFSKKFPKESDQLLRCKNISPNQIDTDKTEIDCQLWDELEELAGTFFDYHGKKTFNRLNSNEKYMLTGDTKFEKEDIEEQPDLTNNFRKFEVSSSPLSSLMGGGAGLGGGLLGGGKLLAGALGKQPMAPALTSQQTQISLEEHGEVLLSMLAALQRKAVIVGGALFEYNYTNENGMVLGSVIALSKDDKLFEYVQQLEKALQLPSCKKLDAKAMLKAFFGFNKNYIKFYDKVRSQLKTTFDQHLGSITQEDYDKEKERESSLDSGIKVDMKARKEREKRLAQLAKSSHDARAELLKKLKERPKSDDNQEESEEERAFEMASIELSLTEDEIEKLNQSLQDKRLELESKMELESQRREELEEAILEEQRVRDIKRQELEVQRQKKAEAEKAEFARRQQRLTEERKKREEVKKMRAKSLREAFDRAREAAMRKQESKTGKPGDDKPKAQKSEKKKYNPEAVKMMIRFGTDDRKIMTTTGISEDDLVELKDAVSQEDANL